MTTVSIEIDPTKARGRGFAVREKPSLRLPDVPDAYRTGPVSVVPLTGNAHGMDFARRYLLAIEGTTASEVRDYMTFQKYPHWFTYNASPCTWELHVFMITLFYAPVSQRDGSLGLHSNYATTVTIPELAGIETDTPLALATIIANRCAGVRVVVAESENK